MPIQGLSDIVRLPRLGKIRLGVKDNDGGYPRRVDYFVCPDAVRKLYGEKPITLPISFPSSNPDIIAQQWYKKYGRTHGLICKGDGAQARAKIDMKTGTHADRNTTPDAWEYKDMTCEGEECPEFVAGNCKRVMSLLVVLHEVPGLGVYQLDTSNRHSIINANSMIFLLKRLTGGRFGMVPLKMSLLKEERQTPDGKKNIECLVFNKDDIKPMDLLKGAAGTNLLVEDIDENEAPDDLYPTTALVKADGAPPARQVIDGKAEHRGAAPPASGKGEPSTSASAPIISPELLKAWLDMRKLQKDLNLDDGLIRGGFRKARPGVEVPKAALSDSPPGWATLEMVNDMNKRLTDYQESVKKVKEFREHLDKQHQAADQAQTEHKQPGEVMDK